MSIVTTEIESTHGGANEQRLIYYKCQDDSGEWHIYGPVISNDANFDAEAYKSTVASRMADKLAEQEAERILE